MKIKIDNASQDKTLFEGEYEYTEDLTKNSEKPAFFISASNMEKGKSGNYELHFSFDNKEELEKFIKSLEEINK